MSFLLCICLFFLFPCDSFARQAPDGFADVAAKILPSVVSVDVDKSVSADNDKLRDMPLDNPLTGLLQKDAVRSRYDKAVGAGFIVDPSGLIMTNYHVLDKAENIVVTTHNGKEYAAEIVGFDKKTDIALLKIVSDASIKAVKLGNSDEARVGDWILAVGNPFGLGNSVSSGIISARSRDINFGPYDDYIQTDAPLNHGNSGGPMFNMKGEVIGINTAIFSPQGGNIGIGFAIPSNMARWVAENLIKYGKIRRGMLGIKIQNLNREIAESIGIAYGKGVLIAAIDAKSPAETAGLKVGDIIVKYDGAVIKAPKQLTKMVAESKIGSKVKVGVLRNRKELYFMVTVAEMADDSLNSSSARPITDIYSSCDGKAVDDLGIVIADINDALREKYKISGSGGVVVCKVAMRTEAMRKNLREGNVIREINQREVKNVDEFMNVIENLRLKMKRSVLLLVQGDTGAGFVALKLPVK